MTPAPEVAAVLDKPQVFTFAFTVLLSAFLMFQVELMMGKFLLPRFGGGPSVWNTALLVFQLLLLSGYGYAAFLSTRFSPKLQGIIHLCLLTISGLTVGLVIVTRHSPFAPGPSWMPRNTDNPVLEITALLISAVGIQCLLLSATSPLLQSWLSRKHNVPYRLYALSNLGSLVGLLAYPVLVERVLTLPAQTWFWTAGYALFLLLASACAVFRMRRLSEPTQGLPLRPGKGRGKTNLQDTRRRPRILWLALAACSCTMLLATTNLICQQIAPVPLLWVVPLALYLLSFVICFDHERWYQRGVFYPFYLVLALMALKALPSYSEISITRLVVIYCFTLMAICMVCHGELARLKPAAPEQLTSFYLMISAGGALGSAAVVVLAPLVFSRFWEFQIALLGCAVLLVIVVLRDRSSWAYRFSLGMPVLVIAVIVLGAGTYRFTGKLLDFEGEGDIVAARSRNFFGIKSVLNEEAQTVLVHGHTLHGLQRSDPATHNEPTMYYARQSGIGLLLDNYPRAAEHEMRVGVIGMGAGTLAAYGRNGDYYRFYEIDPQVTAFSLGAHPPFTFVQSSAAHVDVVIGDARVKMQEEVSSGRLQNFDVLVVDAFSGDSVPVHLLTREAMALYLQQLRDPQSVVAIHLSSTDLDLRPVAESLARSYGLASVEVDTPPEVAPVWVLMSRDVAALRLPALDAVAHPVPVTQEVRTWTDDYSNLYQLLKW